MTVSVHLTGRTCHDVHLRLDHDRPVAAHCSCGACWDRTLSVAEWHVTHLAPPSYAAADLGRREVTA